MSQDSIRGAAGLPLLVTHVAARLGVSERTVRLWAASGLLPARRLGKKIWTFDWSDVVGFARCQRPRREER
jgi:excisionase family DNA binding protein